MNKRIDKSFRLKGNAMFKTFAEVKRQVLWLEAFGFVGPWRRAWWCEVGRRIGTRIGMVKTGK